MNPKTMLTLFGLDADSYSVEPIISETESEIDIFITLNDDNPRRCPYCHSSNVVIKETREIRISYSVLKHQSKPIFILLTKRKYFCKKCHKTYMQKTELVRQKHTISNETCWTIHEKCKEIISFKSITKFLSISEPTVRTIFNEMVKIGRSALPTALCIDEKRFSTNYGKYICIISNPFNGTIVDVINSRTNPYLFDYFSKISPSERKNVKYFVSDMFEGYRTIKRKFFPDAIHIIDHFHVTKLFTDVLQKMRKQYMYTLEKDDIEYKFIKKNWRLFLYNPYLKKNIGLSLRTDFNTGEIVDIKELMKRSLRKSNYLLEIYNLYSDYCEYLNYGFDDKYLNESLEFIINKALNSTNTEIQRIGATLLNFYNEILNYYLSKNKYKLSNATAESINNLVSKLISISYGIKDFLLFRKRLLYISSTKKEGDFHPPQIF